jgi:hypothetical protein
MTTLKKRAHWIGGTLIAFAGVGLARLLAPTLPSGFVPGATVAGHLLALGGLLFIAMGTRVRKM